ncbi:bifunctional glutamate N-acetyltransferase/amino-acid acetyltransferase ArgJ [Rhodobacteraceae bacterium NNCM2]|nr:bifunctional glutamate N-acetyltransferase/amino-acid acetyltransferase ArgJ [Coraliihabitans acroporae]
MGAKKKTAEKKPADKNKKLVKKLEKRQAKLAELMAEIAGIEAEMGVDRSVSPLAPETFPTLAPVAGVRLASGAAGVKYKNRNDVMLAELATGSVMAGTFTKSETRAAPVLWCQERLAALAAKPARRKLGIVVNSGNANAFTGSNGMVAVEEVMGAAGKAIGVAKGNMFMASTGVIGEPLPHDRITAKLEKLAGELAEDALEPAARAIMTTDTFAKGASETVMLGETPVVISGIAKGSGMIAPDMATMLVFIFTDCAISQELLQGTVGKLTDVTFNAITVDSDTSTSDTLLVGATCKAPMEPIESRRDSRYAPFEDALHRIMKDLALQVVRDGEGATKQVAINVTGAKSARAAKRIALSIANSPLVKTAIAGEDPNWGRIVMAVGKSGEAADRDKLSIRFGDIVVADGGWVADSYLEEAGAGYMTQSELEISVDVGVGTGKATVWTCDLTKRYIEINADYRS